MRKTKAAAVYGVLVTDLGAPLEALGDFVNYFSLEKGCQGGEWRFQGKLGFGGKFYLELDGMRVDCYPEDKHSNIKLLITRTNHRLSMLWQCECRTKPKSYAVDCPVHGTEDPETRKALGVETN